MRRLAVAWAAVAILSACAGGRGARIREIRSDDASECRYLGAVENSDRSGWSMSDDELGAMAAIRRRVAEMGGNAFVITHGKSNSYSPDVQADVYRCP